MFRKIWWFLIASMKEIGNMILLLIISYLTIIINVFIISGLKDTTLVDILKRHDILNAIITASISMLAGIFVLELSKKGIRKWVSLIITGNSIFAVIISSILTLQIEKNDNFFDFDLLFKASITFVFISLLLVFITNYSYKNVKEYIEIQKTANESRGKDKFDLDETSFKL
ncbi:hypothetical protein ACMGD3_11020 [Lysinibacillus sphaericus]|uniref:hypothetical protein n=1 Tax=Lysinibacillus sphaericus TaxID=1421 RepID=UPI003F78F16A